MPRWTFIRHGQSVANAQGWFAGHEDAPLTELGRSQAHEARQSLGAARFDRALCSDLARAHETALILTRDLDVKLEVTPTLRERTCGSWEGTPIAKLEDAGELDLFTSWAGRPGGGESLRDVAHRVIAMLAGLPEVEHTLVVSHGALMRAVIGTLDGLPHDEVGAWRPGNCEAVVREATPQDWQRALERT